MGIFKGSCTFSRYYSPRTDVDPFEIDIEGALKRNAAPDIEAAGESATVGWATPSHLLDTDFTLEKVLHGDWLFLVMRTDRRTVSESLVNAYLQIELDAAAHAGKPLSRGARADLKDAIRADLLKKTLPRVSGVDFAWNLKKGTALFASRSNSATDAMLALFTETFGFSLSRADVRETVARKGDEEKLYLFSDLLPAAFHSRDAKAPEPGAPLPLADEFVGREFLTWLWFAAEEGGGEFVLPDGTAVGLAVEDYLVFSSGSEGQRSILRNGTPTLSAEAATALASGRMLEKVRLTLSDGEEEWAFVLDADGLGVSSAKLPRGEERHPAGRMRERAESLLRLSSYVDGLFWNFLDVRLSEEEWEGERVRVCEWVERKNERARSKNA